MSKITQVEMSVQRGDGRITRDTVVLLSAGTCHLESRNNSKVGSTLLITLFQTYRSGYENIMSPRDSALGSGGLGGSVVNCKTNFTWRFLTCQPLSFCVIHAKHNRLPTFCPFTNVSLSFRSVFLNINSEAQLLCPNGPTNLHLPRNGNQCGSSDTLRKWLQMKELAKFSTRNLEITQVVNILFYKHKWFKWALNYLLQIYHKLVLGHLQQNWMKRTARQEFKILLS